MAPHERLHAWRACLRLWVEIYRVTERWPRREWYGLAAQIRRAALSSGSNIAEGMAKRGTREMAPFVDIAFGSVTEVSYQLLAAKAVGILSEAEYLRLSAIQASAGKLTWRLLESLRKRARSDTQPPNRPSAQLPTA